MVRAFVAIAVTIIVVGLPLLAQQKLLYPNTKRVDQVDTYFGVKVADPYRWLEDDNSAETAKWVEEENKVTFGYLDKIPYRQNVKARLEKLYNYPKYGAPTRRGEYFFFAKNDGLQNQSVYYVQKGLDGTPELLLDPNKFSKDGTSELSDFEMSKDGKYLAYGISEGGSDWHELHGMEVATRKVLPDVMNWVKVSGVAWQGDGFYYSRYDAPAQGEKMTSSNDDHKVFFHHVGTTQSALSELVFQDKANPQRFHTVGTSEDERFAILDVSDRGKGKDGNAVFFRDAKANGAKPWNPLIPEITNDTYDVVDSVGDKLLVRTNHDAPNYKVVLVDPKNPRRKRTGFRRAAREAGAARKVSASRVEKAFSRHI